VGRSRRGVPAVKTKAEKGVKGRKRVDKVVLINMVLGSEEEFCLRGGSK